MLYEGYNATVKINPPASEWSGDQVRNEEQRHPHRSSLRSTRVVIAERAAVGSLAEVGSMHILP